jgi:hypothetical protein
VDQLAHAVTGSAALNRDVVLRWTVDAERPEAALHVADGHALITLEPPEMPPRDQVVPREFIWVIDQSCSMSGEPIGLVREAMRSAVGMLDERDSVRVVRFNDTVVGRSRSRPVTPGVRRDVQRTIGRGDGAWSVEVEPRQAASDRAIPSTWARTKIGSLERDQAWGEVPELADAILETSLGYGGSLPIHGVSGRGSARSCPEAVHPVDPA